MARADSSSKALIKAAIRSKCHRVAHRYPEQRLHRLQQVDTSCGSNGKWLVLCDELFEEVCDDFTVRKLDMSLAEKRVLFDAEWVSQVTYGTVGLPPCSPQPPAEYAADVHKELITKPARPRRRNANHSGRGRTPNSAGPGSKRQSVSEPPLADFGDSSEPTSLQTLPLVAHRATASAHAVSGLPVLDDMANSKMQTTSETSTPTATATDQNARRGGPAWFTTILN
ncbi:hypothetical protein CERZMDRAFT_100480 [Cercospora zeae-maydis SCOH1-5]|uniref:Uncharacterized protein n=1 Tax=Cercospora zeae-maydis SCOH1-5 TaxID=717836 RepID=A0A6A6F5T9_9PEZI|nr:hypothetical protein CERZMDRAFT_100480 [Cercospora zeae-maydis SCOH1-5]